MVPGHYTLPLKYCRKKAILEYSFAAPELYLRKQKTIISKNSKESTGGG
jgi:hypothetical protein